MNIGDNGENFPQLDSQELRETLPQTLGEFPGFAGNLPAVDSPTFLERAAYKCRCVSKTLIKGISLLGSSLSFLFAGEPSPASLDNAVAFDSDKRRELPLGSVREGRKRIPTTALAEESHDDKLPPERTN